ncbi:MAG: hypothetical protein Q8R24_00860 [Legionellaceae bacterium]|nr:hypothetical protein [Legionellaceae bacterium]
MEKKIDVKSHIQIDIKVEEDEQLIYNCINGLRTSLKETYHGSRPDFTKVDLKTFVVKYRPGPGRSTQLQEKIYNNILLELEADAKSGDFEALFKGYTVNMHRTFQHYYYAIYDILTELHPTIKNGKKSNNEPLAPFRAPFLQLIDFELLFVLEKLSKTGVLSKSKMQYILEQSVDHYAFERKFKLGDTEIWGIHPAVKDITETQIKQAINAFIAEQEKYPAMLQVIEEQKREYEEQQLALYRATSDQGVMQLRLEEDKRQFAVEQERYVQERTTLAREQDQLQLEREKFNEENTPYQRIKQLEEENTLLRANVGCIPSSWLGFGMFSTRQKSTATTESATPNMAIM